MAASFFADKSGNHNREIISALENFSPGSTESRPTEETNRAQGLY